MARLLATGKTFWTGLAFQLRRSLRFTFFLVLRFNSASVLPVAEKAMLFTSSTVRHPSRNGLVYPSPFFLRCICWSFVLSSRIAGIPSWCSRAPQNLVSAAWPPRAGINPLVT